LAGAVLSGCAPVDTAFGAAWDDARLPPDSVAPESLLTAGRVRDFAAAVQGTSSPVAGVPYRGLRVSARPGSEWQERVAVVASSLAAARTAGWLSADGAILSGQRLLLPVTVQRGHLVQRSHQYFLRFNGSCPYQRFRSRAVASPSRRLSSSVLLESDLRTSPAVPSTVAVRERPV
jgi:hypothetical protein